MGISNKDTQNSTLCQMWSEFMIDAEGNTVSADLTISFTLPGFAEITVTEEGITVCVLERETKNLREFTPYSASWLDVSNWLLERK
jgi:hypothetical protein